MWIVALFACVRMLYNNMTNVHQVNRKIFLFMF